MSTNNKNKSCTKRSLLDCDIPFAAPRSPLKKRRTNAYLKSIERTIPAFNDFKLRIDPRASANTADDALFLNPTGRVNERHTQWVLASKFVIAANWKVDGNRIPQNMRFFVDEQQNLCAFIEDEHCDITRDVVHHCRQIETSVVRKYRRQRLKGENVSDSEDSDIDNGMVAVQHPVERQREEEMVYIVRIPAIYYAQNLKSSFYLVCCRTAKHLQRMQHYGHPLFQILFKNIANFDSFQLSVPMVSLRGPLYAMFCQFGLGVSDHENVKKHHVMSRCEFRAFLGLFDCWIEMKRREQCRKTMFGHCAKEMGFDLDVMKLIVEWTGLGEMDESMMLEWTDRFDTKSTSYKQYKNELRAHISNLQEIVDFRSE